MNRDLRIRGYTVAQAPNLPLAVAIVAVIAGWILSEGSTAFYIARAFFYVGLTIWAYQELTEGVNGFRRLLGAAGLAFIIYSLTVYPD